MLYLVLQMPAVCTMVLFFFSLLVVVAPHSRWLHGFCFIASSILSRFLSQLWIVTGLFWMVSGWFTIFVQNFTDKSDVWIRICLVSQIIYSSFSPFSLLVFPASDPDFVLCSDCSSSSLHHWPSSCLSVVHRPKASLN